jgi:hypothetical protein
VASSKPQPEVLFDQGAERRDPDARGDVAREGGHEHLPGVFLSDSA